MVTVAERLLRIAVGAVVVAGAGGAALLTLGATIVFLMHGTPYGGEPLPLVDAALGFVFGSLFALGAAAGVWLARPAFQRRR